MIFFTDPSELNVLVTEIDKKELLFLKCRVSKLPGEFSGFYF